MQLNVKNRDLTIRQRRRPLKLRWKIDSASFHVFSRLCTKQRDPRAELLFYSENLLLFWRSCYRRSFVRSLTLNLWLLWFCSLWLVDTVNALKVGHLRDRPWLSVWEMCPRLIVSRGNVTPVILKLNQFAMNTRVEQNSSKLEHCNSKVELISHCTIKRSFQANVHGFVA